MLIHAWHVPPPFLCQTLYNRHTQGSQGTYPFFTSYNMHSKLKSSWNTILDLQLLQQYVVDINYKAFIQTKPRRSLHFTCF